MNDSAADAQRVRTLDELDTWHFDGTALAVLGDPVEHSLSPVMHNAALAAMAQTRLPFGSWRYFKFRVSPQELPEALERFHAAGFHGLNLTVPHKIEVLKILGPGALSPFARSAGAANTLIRQPRTAATANATADANAATAVAANAAADMAPNATTAPASASPAAAWRGDNTDGYGLEQALLHELGFPLPGATVLLLGAGGAARAAATHCLMGGVKNLWIANRGTERLNALVNSLQALAAPGQSVQGLQPQALPAALLRERLAIVNATSVGLKADDPAPIDLAAFDSASTVVYDMTYGVENTLARSARERGIRFADGLSMLVWQGARSLELWSASDVPAHIMHQALLNHRAKQP